VVHPAAGIQTGTLNALAYHFETLDECGLVRPGIVHRIDKGTSGLLVVAKTEMAHEHLIRSISRAEGFQVVSALVHGASRRYRPHEQPLARIRGIVPAWRSCGAGELSLKVQRRYDRFTLLDVEIKTGRLIKLCAPCVTKTSAGW
jgi:23S rRNA pseudouridine1911/1915/1917 synthase